MTERRNCAARFGRRMLALALLAGALGATIAAPPRPRLVWNVSASAPIGLYAVLPGKPATGDFVIARVPQRHRLLAARRRYLPLNVPLVKRVAAVPGDRVCAQGMTVFVNARRVARRQPQDGAGRAMPWWTGCLVLSEGALFLLMTSSSASFDGRYFGPTVRGDIIGRAIPLWVR